MYASPCSIQQILQYFLEAPAILFNYSKELTYKLPVVKICTSYLLPIFSKKCYSYNMPPYAMLLKFGFL